jgi:hypothetical protein
MADLLSRQTSRASLAETLRQTLDQVATLAVQPWTHLHLRGLAIVCAAAAAQAEVLASAMPPKP